MLDDGTAGLFYVRRHGGITIVQDPEDAEFPSMPANALAHVKIDYKISLKDIAQTINRLVKVEWSGIDVMKQSDEPSGMDAIIAQDRQRSVPTNYTCPDCHGPLSKIQDGSPTIPLSGWTCLWFEFTSRGARQLR